MFIVHQFVIITSLTEPAFAFHDIGHFLQTYVLKRFSSGPTVGCVEAFEIIEPGFPLFKPGAIRLPARAGIVRPFFYFVIIHGQKLSPGTLLIDIVREDLHVTVSALNGPD